jgi:hypothetical protein
MAVSRRPSNGRYSAMSLLRLRRPGVTPGPALLVRVGPEESITGRPARHSCRFWACCGDRQRGPTCRSSCPMVRERIWRRGSSSTKFAERVQRLVIPTTLSPPTPVRSQLAAREHRRSGYGAGCAGYPERSDRRRSSWEGAPTRARAHTKASTCSRSADMERAQVEVGRARARSNSEAEISEVTGWVVARSSAGWFPTEWRASRCSTPLRVRAA